jgi:hypothetical protein
VFSTEAVDQRVIEEALEIAEALGSIERFRSSLNGEEYIRVLCETCRKHLSLPVVLVKGFSTLATLSRASTATAQLCLKYALDEILVAATKQHLGSVNQQEVAKIALANAALATSTAGGSRKSILSSGLTNSNEANTALSGASANTNLFYTVLTLLGTFTADAGIKFAVCQSCCSSVLAMLKVFIKEPVFVSKSIRLLGMYSLDDASIAHMLRQGTVKAISESLREHMGSISISKSTLDLLSNLASLVVTIVNVMGL